MAEIVFPYQVKYSGKYFSANEPFEITDESVESLIAEGGTLLEANTKPIKNPITRKSTKKRG